MESPRLRLKIIAIFCVVSVLAADTRQAFAMNDKLDRCTELVNPQADADDADAKFLGGFFSGLVHAVSGFRRRLSIGAPDATAVHALLLDTPVLNAAEIAEESRATRALRQLLKFGRNPVLAYFRSPLHSPGLLGKRPVAFNQVAADELFPDVVQMLQHLRGAMEAPIHQGVIRFEPASFAEQKTLISNMIESLQTSGEPDRAPPGKEWFVNSLKLEWPQLHGKTTLLTFVASLVVRYGRDNDEVTARAVTAVKSSLESLSQSARAAERARLRGREAWWATKRTKILAFGAVATLILWQLYHPTPVVQPEITSQHPEHASGSHDWSRISPAFERWLKSFDEHNARIGAARVTQWPDPDAAIRFLATTMTNYQALGESLRKTLPIHSHVGTPAAVQVSKFTADQSQTLLIGAAAQYENARNSEDATAIEIARNRYWDVLSGQLIDASLNGQTASAGAVLQRAREDLHSPLDAYRFLGRLHSALVETRLQAQSFAWSMRDPGTR